MSEHAHGKRGEEGVGHEGTSGPGRRGNTETSHKVGHVPESLGPKLCERVGVQFRVGVGVGVGVGVCGRASRAGSHAATTEPPPCLSHAHA